VPALPFSAQFDRITDIAYGFSLELQPKPLFPNR
jgi:hypothetical protein